MGEDELKINDIEDLVFDDASLLDSDLDIALHIMHRFNIDMDTVEILPAFDKPLRTFFGSDKK